MPRTEQSSTRVPATSAITGLLLGGPMSGMVTHRASPAAGGGHPVLPVGPGRAAADLQQRPGPGGAVTPSTTTSVTSGAASSIAPLMASWTVTVEEGQPSQLPSRRSWATPSSVTPR